MLFLHGFPETSFDPGRPLYPNAFVAMAIGSPGVVTDPEKMVVPGGWNPNKGWLEACL